MPASFDDILKLISSSIDDFNKNIPGIQQDVLDGILTQLRRLDLVNGNIKTTVANLKIINSVKRKLNRLILTDDYLSQVKDFVNAFTDIANLQNSYWSSIEADFSPKPLLREIRLQAIDDTISSLTEAGIGNTIAEEITGILRTNVTAGGSYKALEKQLRSEIVGSPETDGKLLKYSKQITTDAINQYSAQYTRAVSDSLGFEWFAYQGSDIVTTRPFCDAMTDFRYFHITEIPRLLAAQGLTYVNKSGERVPVPIYARTGLPQGMIEGTNSENFFINRGGYNCGHQIRPVSERVVPETIQERVKATPEYKAYQVGE